MQHGLFTPFDGSPIALAGMACSLVAYLDPGTGSYAVQLMLAGLFGGMFALKQSWADLKVWFHGRFGSRSVLAGTSHAQAAVETDASSPIAPRSQTHGRSSARID